MKTSDPKSTTRTSNPAFLLIGPPGGGKTSLALGFPRPYIADIDLNLDGPLREKKKLNPSFTYFYDSIPFKDDGSACAPEFQFDRLKACVDVAMKSPDVGTIIIDGLTHLDNILKAHVCREQGKPAMDRSSWIPFRRYLIDFIVKVRCSGKTTLFLCHEEFREEEVNGKPVLMKRSPLISSKVTDAFNGFFTDVIRCEARPGAGGKSSYVAGMSKTQYDDLKNTYGLAGEVLVNYGEDMFAKCNKAWQLV